jgi:hypothetical protein
MSNASIKFKDMGCSYKQVLGGPSVAADKDWANDVYRTDSAATRRPASRQTNSVRQTIEAAVPARPFPGGLSCMQIVQIVQIAGIPVPNDQTCLLTALETMEKTVDGLRLVPDGPYNPIVAAEGWLRTGSVSFASLES